MTPKKMHKKLQHIWFDLIKDDPKMEDYRRGGEWAALEWLRAYSKKRATCEPMDMVFSCLRAIGRADEFKGRWSVVNQALMAETILRYTR